MNNNVFRNLSYGVYIISCKDENKYTGCTVNSIMQVTSSPATIALSVNRDNYTNSCICEHKKFAVSILSEKSNQLLVQQKFLLLILYLTYISNFDHYKSFLMFLKHYQHLLLLQLALLNTNPRMKQLLYL